MASSSPSAKPSNNERENATVEMINNSDERLSELEARCADLHASSISMVAPAKMLHHSSGRHNFGLVTTTCPTLSCPRQVSNFIVRLKDQVMQAIARADKEEANTSSLDSTPNTRHQLIKSIDDAS